MTASEIEKCRKRLEQFLGDLLEPLGRRERRQWSSVYVRGLLLEGERKTIEPMAARLPEGNVQATWASITSAASRSAAAAKELACAATTRPWRFSIST